MTLKQYAAASLLVNLLAAGIVQAGEYEESARAVLYGIAIVLSSAAIVPIIMSLNDHCDHIVAHIDPSFYHSIKFRQYMRDLIWPTVLFLATLGACVGLFLTWVPALIYLATSAAIYAVFVYVLYVDLARNRVVLRAWQSQVYESYSPPPMNVL